MFYKTYSLDHNNDTYSTCNELTYSDQNFLLIKYEHEVL